MLRQRADSKRLGCVVSRINDREFVLFGVNGGPMWALTHNQCIDFHFVCLLEGFGRSTSASANSPSLRLAVTSDETRPYFASVALCEFSGLLNEHCCLGLVVPTHANGNSLEFPKLGAWLEAQLLREQHVVPK